jgi:hypothetical protein
VDSSDARPTDQSRVVLAKLSAELDVQLAALDQALARHLPELNRALRARGLSEVR